MNLARLALAFLACFALSACDIKISVPSSGRVTTTSGAYACEVGQSCTVTVSDAYFDETFEAEPADGFVFKGWKQQPGHLCGGATGGCRVESSSGQTNPDALAIIENPDVVVYLRPEFESTGFRSLFIGHSFFRPFAEGMPFHAAEAGIPNHSQSIVFSGGSSGAPEALWNNASKRTQIQAILDEGDIELFVMTYHPDYPGLRGYRLWMDYALAQNPDTRFAVALPWEPFPEQTDAATYESNWHAFLTGTLQPAISLLRNQYPGTEIFCIPYGQSAVELRSLLAAGELPDVDVMLANPGEAIYRDALGHADDILIDLGRLVWLRSIYGIDLTAFDHDPGYVTDLKAIAQTITDEHDPVFDAPYR